MTTGKRIVAKDEELLDQATKNTWHIHGRSEKSSLDLYFSNVKHPVDSHRRNK